MQRHLLLLSTIMLLSACGGGGSSSGGASDRDSAPTPKTVVIHFKAVADTTPIACAATYSLGSANTPATLEDFRFYIHNLRLVSSSGAEIAVTLDQNDWQNGAVALLDFQDKADKCTGDAKTLHTTITGTVPDDSVSFSSVRFSVGVPEDRNHLLSSSQPSPLNVASLFWSWQSGYKFMRLDFAPVGGGSLAAGGTFTAWNFHLGSTGCSGDPQTGATVTCTNFNRPDIALDNFNPEADSIQLDYAALVVNNDLGADAGGAPGCMSGTGDPECNDVFTALGLNLASGNNDASLVQTAFSVAH